MKYSAEQQKLHLEIVYSFIAKDPSMSARAICRALEKQNIHLNRGYVTKLVWQACNKLTTENRNKINRMQEIQNWLQELTEVAEELGNLKTKLREMIWHFPIKTEDEEQEWRNY